MPLPLDRIVKILEAAREFFEEREIDVTRIEIERDTFSYVFTYFVEFTIKKDLDTAIRLNKELVLYIAKKLGREILRNINVIVKSEYEMRKRIKK